MTTLDGDIFNTGVGAPYVSTVMGEKTLIGGENRCTCAGADLPSSWTSRQYAQARLHVLSFVSKPRKLAAHSRLFTKAQGTVGWQRVISPL